MAKHQHTIEAVTIPAAPEWGVDRPHTENRCQCGYIASIEYPT